MIPTRYNICLCWSSAYPEVQIARIILVGAVISAPGHYHIDSIGQHGSVILGQGVIAISFFAGTHVDRKFICNTVAEQFHA